MNRTIVLMLTMLLVFLIVSGCESNDDKKPIQRTVTFYDNGFIASELTLVVEDGTVITLPNRTKDGYTLNAWNFHNDAYSPQQQFTVNDNVIFYSSWTSNTAATHYTATFYNDGAIIPELTQMVKSGTQGIFPTITKEGYSLAGWVKNNYGYALTGKFDINGDTKYYAKWITPVIEINNAEQFNSIRNNLSGNYKLMSNISLSGYDNWIPIGKVGNDVSYFTGQLDGNGYKITDLRINSNGTSGLFAGILKGKIMNLVLENINIVVNGSNDSSVGGIAGYIGNFSIIENSYVKGSITVEGIASNSVGGIVGNMDGGGSDNNGKSYTNSIITRCYSSVIISASNNSTRAGGIAGGMDSSDSTSTIENSYSTGSITSINTLNVFDTSSGGIVGSMFGGRVINCYSSASIVLTGSSSYSVGGIIGSAYTGPGGGEVVISNCVAINPTIDGRGNVGRIVGYSPSLSSISNNFALESMQALGATFNEAIINHGVNKSDVQLKTESTYSDPINGNGLGGLGWKFGNDDENPWKMPTSGGYPILYWQ